MRLEEASSSLPGDSTDLAATAAAARASSHSDTFGMLNERVSDSTVTAVATTDKPLSPGMLMETLSAEGPLPHSLQQAFKSALSAAAATVEEPGGSVTLSSDQPKLRVADLPAPVAATAAAAVVVAAAATTAAATTTAAVPPTLPSELLGASESLVQMALRHTAEDVVDVSGGGLATLAASEAPSVETASSGATELRP